MSMRSVDRLRIHRQRQNKLRQQLLLRNLKLESLEDRRLMAVGPQLAGVLPDDGHLLLPNETLHVAPLDLTFRFDEGQIIDVNTVSGVQVWRSGYDGKFTPASASSDFGTNRAVEITFSAKALGVTENGITVSVTKADLGTVSLPQVTVSNRNIAIRLNTNSANNSTAQDIVSAISASTQASQLISAAVTAGSPTTNVSLSDTTTYSPLTLTGANAASFVDNFIDGSGNVARLKFTATTSGQAGNGTRFNITRANLPAGAAPIVSVSTGTVNVVNVILNNTSGSRSRASDLIRAVNLNSQAAAIGTIALIGGTATTDVATAVSVDRSLVLDGANDALITPGFLGIGASPREVIARFKETLPDDLYHIDVFGDGPLALKNSKGEKFNNAVNFQQKFELDLGAQVVAVVPQPVDRSGSTLTQRRNQIDVYFNNDDLNTASATNPAFYQLIFSRNTVQNTDDTVFTPVSVSYDKDLDKATLTFGANLDQLPTGAGTYRLRIGTTETAPLAPQTIRPIASITSDFNTAGAATLQFDAVNPGEAGSDIAIVVQKSNLGPGVAPLVSVFGKRINVLLNNTTGSQTTAQQLIDALNNTPSSAALIRASLASGTASTNIAAPNITYSPVKLSFTQGLGSSFDTALNVGTLTQSVVYTSAIDPEVFTLDFPGDNAEPGHRDINVPGENHLGDDAADSTPGISTYQYNFRSDYGYDPMSGTSFFNVITENQKQRAREALEIVSQVAGVQFVETSTAGFTIATGDLRAILGCPITGPGTPINLSASGLIHLPGTCIFPDTRQSVVLDSAEGWDDSYGGTWFQRAMHEIFAILGLENSYDLPPGNIQGNDGPALTTSPLTNVNSSTLNTSGLEFDNTIEPSFPGAGDIVHLQHVFRPESKDIDLYRFTIDKLGMFSAETIAERRFNSSLLDTALRLYKEVDLRDTNGVVVGKTKQLISQNDDYFSKDSLIQLALEPGVYWIGVSASGNTSYDPTIEDTGIGGKSQGEYDLRLNFRPNVTNALTDATGTMLDGDADGVPGGAYNFWFRAQSPANVLFVDKAATTNGPGTIASPFNNIASALNAAANLANTLGAPTAGPIVRIVGNPGADGSMSTLADNRPYEIGFNQLGNPLPDGALMQVPKGVTVMVDAGAIFKLRRAEIGVGSASPSVDRSGGALQVLGTTTQSVYFTSYDDATIGLDTNPDTSLPLPGAWGGLAFRRDIDRADLTRFDYEEQGIFLNYVNHADIRFGGGSVVVDSVTQPVSSIHMVDARPTISYNLITRGSDAAMSASPNSFEETNFNAPKYQRVPFTLDYDRVGPDIHGNRLDDGQGNSNSINGLSILAGTPAGNALRPMTVTGRWDDRDIVHVVSENLVVQGTPGGPVEEVTPGPLNLVTVSRVVGGGAFAAGTYDYKMTFIDAQGNETPASGATATRTVAANDQIILGNLLTPASGFVGRRIYRSSNQTGGASASPYVLVAQINATDVTFTDRGNSLSAVLNERPVGYRSRQDAGLTIDPAIVVKLDGASISTQMGARFVAEATLGLETIFTSLADDRFGAGSTFQTKKDGKQNNVVDPADANAPRKGDWAGLILGPYSSGGLDNVVVAFGGGVTRVEGSFTGMNALEIHQSEARVTNSLFEYNENGLGGQAPVGRFGRGFNEEATIFVRGAQPVIVGNTLRNNDGPAVSINVNAVTSDLVTDWGRSRGAIDRVTGYADNQGPLVRENRLDRNKINGMVVRGETLNTESVWDDTDIVHVMMDSVYITDFHTYGGVRLESSPNESLVVKSMSLDARGTNNLPDFASFVANGRPLEIDDRIGGILQVVGQPGYPVVLTSLMDNSVGAGLAPDGTPSFVTLQPVVGDPTVLPTTPNVAAGTLIDNNVPTNTIGHFEARPAAGGLINTSGVSAQGNTQLLINQNYITQFANFVDVGSNGQAINLSTTTITQAPTLIAPDVVASTGTFAGPNGTVTWRAESRFNNGVATVFNTLQFSSTAALGNIRVINYFDPGILVAADDLLLQTGTPGTPGFRAAILDGAERIGFSHGGAYTQGIDLVNATYTGWAADRAATLLAAITGAGSTYSVPGNIAAVLPGITDNQLGRVNGPDNIATAFAWNVSPTASAATVTSFLELISSNPAREATPGDWRGLIVGEFAHDRNVAATLEKELPAANSSERNGTINSAQFIGQLAPSEKAGDENRRLGFTIQGTIAKPGDMDIYSFTADAGTPVWIDIDRTTQALDTVVELLDGNGMVLAQSDNSLDELNGQRTIYTQNGTAAFPMKSSTLSDGKDRWSVNPRDAGMRVVLPGPIGTTSTYHVRVGSSSLTAADRRANPNAVADVTKGLTSGSYQLQLRLRELDEIGGTAVQNADIRFAENGIQIIGQPTHSPLLGETAEAQVPLAVANPNSDTNDTFATAQRLGNLLTSDRGAISVSGNLTNYDDVDWYRLDVDYTELSSIVNGNIGAIFDIDYADGISRPDTNLSIFDSQGRLILMSGAGNIAEDRPGPLQGANVGDLSRGSVGALDPYLGTVNLPTGTNSTGPRLSTGPYFIAVSANQRLPLALNNPLVRLEPINSTARIVWDPIETTDLFDHNTLPVDPQYSTAQTPVTPKLFDANSVVPYSLSDLKLFISYDNSFNTDLSTLATVNPFTGQIETIVNNNGQAGAFYPQDVGDIAMRADGRLYAFTRDLEDTSGPSDAGAANLINIDTGTGASKVINNTGITTYEDDPANPGTPIVANNVNNARVGYGVNFNATSFVPNQATNITGAGQQLLAIGNRADIGVNNGVGQKRNLLYWFTNDLNSGVNLGAPQPTAKAVNLAASATDIQAIGQILSGAQITAVEATVPSKIPTQATYSIPDQMSFDISDGVSTTTFEFDSGPEVQQKINITNPNQVIRDGQYFELDPDPAIADNETIYQFDTGSVINVTQASNPGWAGLTLTVNGNGPVGKGPAASVTFEFVDKNVNKGAPLNATATPIDITGNISAAGIAGFIATAINAAAPLGITASTVGNRVTMANEIRAIPGPGLSPRVLVEGDVGRAPILRSVDGGTAGLNTSTFRIALASGVNEVFEFTTSGKVSVPTNRPITFTVNDDARTIANQITTAVTAVTGITAQLVTDPANTAYGRVIVNGQGIGYFQGSSPIADLTTLLPTTQISVEETFTDVQIGAIIADPITGIVPNDAVAGFNANYELDRLHFPTVNLNNLTQPTIAKAADFRSITTWIPRGQYGVAPGNVAIGFEADDVASTRIVNVKIGNVNVPFTFDGISQRIADAVNGSGLPGVTAIVNGSDVILDNPSGAFSIPRLPPPLIGGGQGPGGDISGMAAVNGQIYAVSDRGGLYRITVNLDADPTKVSAKSQYIASSAQDLQGIHFTGLATGPQTTENGRYSNMLFATDDGGRIYAFNTAGVLQPVFVDGKSSVQIHLDQFQTDLNGDGRTDLEDDFALNFDISRGNGLGDRSGVQGLAFSTLEESLWQITPTTDRPVTTSATAMDVRVGAAKAVGAAIAVDTRPLDVGHGRISSYDTTRFGRLDPTIVCTARLASPPEDFPECGLSSLHFGQGNVGGVARTYDFPGGAHGSLVSNEFSLKGYTAADQPTLYFTYFLNTENANQPPTNFDSVRVFVGGDDGTWTRVAHNDDSLPSVNLLDNTGGWRQARVSLGGFAGAENLRLRVDFSTAGDMNVGDPETTGDELRAVAASKLRDGQTFQIDTQTFELDFGYTLVPPSGAAIRDGERFTVGVGNTLTTYEFDDNGALASPANIPILLDKRQTAEDVARLIEASIRLSGPGGVTPNRVDNRVNLSGATSLTQTLSPSATRFGVVLEGAPGVTPGNAAVSLNSLMTRVQVAQAIDAALEPAFVNQTLIVNNGQSYADGDAFNLDDGNIARNFEFDSGVLISIPAGFQIPDGDLIKLFDSQGNAMTFEFDKDGVVGTGHIPVVISNAMPVATVARTFAAAIQASAVAPLMGMTATVVVGGVTGVQVQIQSNPDVLVKLQSNAFALSGALGVNGSVQLTLPGALGIQIPAAGGAILEDGETFTITDATQTITFELDDSTIPVGAPGYGVTVGNVAIPYAPTDTMDVVGTSIVGVLSGSAIFGIFPSYIGGGIIDLGSDSTITSNLSGTTLIPRGRPGAIVDGETFTIGDGTTTATFEFDSDNLVSKGNIAIPFSLIDVASAITPRVVSAISGSGLTGLTPVAQPLGVVSLGESISHTVNSAGLVNVVRTGISGGNVVRIPFSPNPAFTAAQVASNVATAINSAGMSVTANVNTGGQRRIVLTGPNVTRTFGPGVWAVNDLDFETPNDVVKRDDDLIRVIGHSVTDPGPLGLQTALLRGDQFGQPINSPVLYNNNRAGQANTFEGVYLDDFVIGFAERGEMITGSSANTTGFTLPPQDLGQSQQGPYQLEVRRAAEYAGGSVSPNSANTLVRTFDTNARLTNGISLIAQAGTRYADGQTFSLTGAANKVTFEMEDASIRPGEPGYGVKAGHVALTFNPTDADWQVAAKIRDAINSASVRTALPGVTAALSDGTDGVFFAGASTSNQINIYGEVSYQSIANPINESKLSNDTIATAVDTGIVGISSPAYAADGVIGDNPAFALDKGRDVDLFKVFLNAGELLRIDIDAAETGSTLDATLAVFNSSGVLIASNTARAAAGEFPTSDPYIEFTPTISGNYYIGVSGAAPAPFYNPIFEGSGGDGSTGAYRLGLTFGSASPAEYIRYNEVGDTNRVRDQGQLIISGNRISSSASWGIFVDADVRDPNTNAPHQGPVRATTELNSQNLATSVVLMNNLIADNNLGGIRFSGQTNPNNTPTAAVPFGRIVNNTIVGRGGSLVPPTAATNDVGIQVDENASPTILNNIVANAATGISVDATSTTTVVGGSIYQGNTTSAAGVNSEAFAIPLSVTDPLFVNAAGKNFYLKAGSVAIDSSIDTLQDRPAMVTVKSPLGIAPSPILSPDRDLNGLLRVDDPNAEPPSGLGQNIFKDRGAVDRSDFTGSSALLVTPAVANSASNTAQFTGGSVTEFAIQLFDGTDPSDPVNGVGIDDSTVTAPKIFALKDNEYLELGVDYTFRYDSVNNTVRITPTAGVWENNKSYFVELVNRDQFVFTVPNGNAILEGQTFTVNNSVFEFDSGYTIQVPTSLVADGNKLVIRNGIGAVPVTFEFDRNNSVSAGNVPIIFSSTATRDEVANAIVAAINARADLGLTPKAVGLGRVNLGGTVNHNVDVSASTLTLTGTPGAQTAGAYVVPFVPGVVPATATATTPTPMMTDNEVAVAISNAVQTASLPNVRATPRIYNKAGVEVVEMVLRGATSFTGFTNVFTAAIRDLAGNDLKANDLQGSTSFTITLGNGIDFGDAPATYPVSGLGAASHAIRTGFSLGALVDAEQAGQPSTLANADDTTGTVDDEDGIVFTTPITKSGNATITVTATGAGFLDGFIDFNQNGNWDDASDRVLASRAINAGTNTVTFAVPASVTLGNTYARFRFSSGGGLGPGGAASDGEVEDYQVLVSGPAWQNPLNRLDVSGDTFVSSIDALLLINLLNTYGNGNAVALTTPPLVLPGGISYVPDSPTGLDRFFDVNGDGFAAPSDVLAIINQLNNVPSGEGESSATVPVVAQTTVDNASLPATNVAIVSAATRLPTSVFANVAETAATPAPATSARSVVANRPVEFAFNLGPVGSATTGWDEADATELATIADRQSQELDELLGDISTASDRDEDSHDAFFATL